MVGCSTRHSTPADGEIHVWTARVIDDDCLTDGLRELLDTKERVRAARFAQPRHRMSFIQFRAFARQVLGGCLGVPAAEVTFANGRHGKPQLVRGAGRPEIHFNLSHSRDYCVLAARLGCAVGIDLEQVRDMPGSLDIARRHFTRAEAEQLARLDGDARRDAFFALWTHKEAAVKTLGASLAENFERFEFALDPPGQPRLVSFDATQPTPDGLWLRRLDVPPGYVAALASLRPCAKIVSRAWNVVAHDAYAAPHWPAASVRSRETSDHPRGA